MNPSRLFIERPVSTTLLAVALVLVGLLSLGFLPVSALPEVDYPTIQVETFYPGASPDVMTAAVTAPLERQFGQMPGLTQMASNSSAGASVITLQFSLSLGLDTAEQEVQAAINAASNLLPADLPAPPIYAKVNPADAPILVLAVTSPTLPLARVHDLAEQQVAMKLSQLPGIGMVGIGGGGGGRPAIRVRFRPAALAAVGLNIDDLRTTIGNLSVNLPKGGFDGRSHAFSINADDQLLDAHAFRDQVIAWRNGAPVRLSDVASVVDGVENTARAAWMNRTPAVILNVRRQPGGNVIEAVEQVKAKLPELIATLPASVSLAIVDDRTVTIRASVNDAMIELGLAMALVVLVIFVFLRDVRATLIPSLSVPLSLIGTFAAMYLFGFSIDNLSLMSLTVATGFVVDDAIVVIENIARYVEAGLSPRAAALAGSRQIGFTVISLTISLVAVLIPLLFMADVVGRLFHEFAITLAVSIGISAVVSLTVVPMLCARLLGKQPRREAAAAVGGPTAYSKALDWVLDHQRPMLLMAAMTLVVTGVLYARIPKGFFPTQDTGLLEAVTQAPAGVTFADMAARQQAVAAALLTDPAVATLASYIGVDGSNATLSRGRMAIALRPVAERGGSMDEVMRRLAATAETVGGTTLMVQPVQDLTIDASAGVTQFHFLLTGPDMPGLAAWLPQLLARMRQQPALADVSADLQTGGQELRVELDRDTAARFGITAATVDNALYDAFGQRIVSTVFTPTNQYRVILEADAAGSDGDSLLDGIYLPSALASGGQVPLRALATIEPRPTPLQIGHLAQFPSVTVSFNLAHGASLGQAVTAIEAAASGKPPQIRLVLQGAARAFAASLSNEMLLILAAIVTMYIVLGVLYESFIHPLTILSTLPAAAVGALIALMAAGDGLDIIGVIGIVLLIGIVKKNAILMIDFALEVQRSRGLTAREAIREAALLRLRPILMTTCAAMFGALPLMFAHGSGAELRRPLGLAIVGGLLVSQMLTVFTTPVVYLFFDRLAGKRRPRYQAP